MNKCLANSFIQHDTHISTPLYFVMAEYLAKEDHHFHRLLVLFTNYPPFTNHLFLKEQLPVGVLNNRKFLYIGGKPDIFLLITR